MQRMTKAPVVNVAFVWMLLLLVLHLDDPVDNLKDTMRGLAVPRIEQVIIALIDNSCATRTFFRQLEQADKIHQRILALPRQPAPTMSHGNHRKKTISRRLVANGLHSCRPLRRLSLTPPNRRQRLEWCRARSTWMTEWHRVVFSDESRFCLSSDSRRVRVWRRRGERSNPAAIVERPTVRQRGIMVWGAIAYDSRSPLLRIQGTMTAQRYVDDVLRPVTLPYLQGVPNALYQQDNARPHTARISQQALQDVQMLPWPPYSPDLSPIEYVWDIIGRRLHALPQPRSEDELWQMNDVYVWVRDHRMHHKFVDTDADPHNIKRGFFFAHMGWLMCKKHPDVIEKGKTIDMSDVLADPLVRFQRKYFKLLVLVFSLILPTLFGVYVLGESYYISFCVLAMSRYMLILHGTWTVNSLAHYAGYQTFDKSQKARDNIFVSFITLGEGWHNYHHVFPWDYSTSELGYFFNFSKYFIDLMAKIGQAYDLRSATISQANRWKYTKGDGLQRWYTIPKINTED
ncbi:SCD [Cordylochernes scorpioides]|uniref:SCD n=1 Tax=Cordylochernes scorpioides TaxID=51811 RepID=A0ABY6L8W1_9ARAC|nr:SCD [Cordylochernes scorpioides]